MRLLKPLLILGVAAASLLFTTQVSSDPPSRAPEYDVKSYPGTFCQTVLGSPAVAVYVPGQIRNDDPTNTLLITCPIVRDDIVGEDGTHDIIVSIYQGVGGQSNCYAFSYNEASNVIQYVSDSNLDYGNTLLYLDLDESVANGYYDLMCALAPYSRLYSYRVYELQGETDLMTDYDR